MRLLDAKPKWVQLNNWASESDFFVGIRFACPHCGKPLSVPFWPPVDPEKMEGRIFNMPDNAGNWRRTGDTFDSLTLSPSIDVAGHWHGHIINGELITA